METRLSFNFPQQFSLSYMYASNNGISAFVFFFKRKNVPKLSEQRHIVKDAMIPFPLYTCLHVKKDVSAQTYCGKIIKTESTRTSSNIYLSWTKIEYQNNLNPIALFSTLNKR